MKFRWLTLFALIAGLPSFASAKDQPAPHVYKATTVYVPPTVYVPTTVYVPSTTTTPSSRVASRSLYEIAASVDSYHQAPKTLYSSVASVPTQKIAAPASYGTRNYPSTTYSSASTQTGWVKQPTIIRGDLGSVAIQPSVISPLPGYVITTPSVGIAQNGSYYGQPNANGIPKTVAVNGYYRKDGTYVQGHYRSAPGSNPSSSRKK